MTEEELSPSPASQLSSEALIYPQMRRVVPDSDRPIAFFGENILGTKCLQYELPALGDWCWVSTQYENGRLRIHQRLPIDLQSIHSPISESDSGRNSPTMIDLQAAVTEGNTNTGAPVFDMIQGHLFAATHCPRRFEDSFDLSPQPASSFLHRFTSFDPGSSFNDVLDQASLNIGGSATSHCSVNDFLHLDACAEPSSSEPSPPVGFAATVESDFPIAPPMAAWSPTQVDEQAIGALGPPFSSPNEAPDTIMMDARHPPFELPGTSPSHSIEAEAPPASPLTPRKRRRSIDSTNESAFDITSPKKARNHDLIPVAASS